MEQECSPQIFPFNGKGRMTSEMAMIRSDLFLGRLVRFHPEKIAFPEDIHIEPLITVPVLEPGDVVTNVVPLPVQEPIPEPKVINDRPTIKLIVDETSRFYNISTIDICSRRRHADIVRPRHVAMYLSRRLTLRSLPEIGMKIGARDHTTVIASVRKIARLLKEDERLADEIHIIKLRIAQKMLAEAA